MKSSPLSSTVSKNLFWRSAELIWSFAASESELKSENLRNNQTSWVYVDRWIEVSEEAC